MKSAAFRVMLLLFCCATARGNESALPAHLATARALLEAITPERNLYSASPSRIVWADDLEGTAENRSVCSSFGALLLTKDYGFDDEALTDLFGEAAPEADEWFAAVRDSERFQRIATIGAIQPGDFLVIDYLPGKAIPTGHVMLVDSAPRRIAEHDTARPLPWPRPKERADQPLTWKTPLLVEWHLTIIDSSRSPHGEGDTRRRANPDGSDDNGLGRGDLRLLTDREGRLLGYTWSISANSRIWSSAERPLITGRFRSS